MRVPLACFRVVAACTLLRLVGNTNLIDFPVRERSCTFAGPAKAGMFGGLGGDCGV